MVDRKAGCERCQALLAGNGRRCRKLAQCRVRSALNDVALCNVHEEYVRKHGVDSLRYDSAPETRRQASKRASVSTAPALSIAGSKLRLDQSALQRIEEAQRIQLSQMRRIAADIDQLKRQRQPVVSTPTARPRQPSVRPTVPTTAPPLSRSLDQLVRRVEQTARVAHGEVGTLRSLGKTFCRRLSAAQIETQLAPLAKLLDSVDSLIASVRDAIVQANADAVNENNPNLERTMAPVVQKYEKEQRRLQEQLEAASKKVRKALEKRCRQKRFTLAPALRFSQDVLAGKVRCNKSALPLSLRNWFVSGATEQNASVKYNWVDRHLLCNLSDVKGGADKNDDENEEEEAEKESNDASTLSAFASGQELRDNFKVYDTKRNVVAIGRLADEAEGNGESAMGSGIGVGVSGGERAPQADTIDALLHQYLRLLDTLNLLIDLYAVAGRDTRGLAAERHSLRQSIANLALKAGRERALQFMSAERYELLMLQASLTSAYAPYLETEEGVAELASLAAFAASERAHADGVSDKLRRQVARQTYAQTLRALTIVGGAGSLAQTLWLVFAGAPRTAAPIVPTMPRPSPPVSDAQTFGAPALPLPPSAREEASDAALPFVFREQTRENNDLRVQRSIAQLSVQTARDAAAVDTLAPIDGARIKLAALFNDTRSYGARQFPLTRNQWRRDQLNSTLELLSPSSRHIERLYERVRLGGVQVRPRLQQRFEEQARQRARRLRGAAALELPSRSQRERERVALLGERESRGAESVPLLLPRGGLYEGIGPSGPVSLLPGEAAGAAITAPSALGQLASNANLLSVIAQAMGPAPPIVVEFDPAVQRLMQERGFNVSDVEELLAANAAMFADRTTLLSNYDRGLGALQKYRAQRYGPSGADRRRDPQSAAALASASAAALSAVADNEADFFDDLRAPALGDAAQRASQNRTLSAIEETPLHFLQQVAGVVGPGGLSSADVQRMSQRIDSVVGGFTNNTALDMHLDSAFERFRASGASALEIGIDAGMLAATADDSGVALRAFQLRGGTMSAERRRQAEQAVDAAALYAEREFGGGEAVQQTATLALRARELRQLYASDAAALHGFVSGLVEKAFQVQMAALERANDVQHVFASLVHKVGGVAVREAAIVAERIGESLAALGERALEQAKSREQLDRLLFTTLSQDLRGVMTDDRLHYIVDAALDGLGETGRVSTAAAQTIGSALKTYGKDASVVASNMAAQLSDALAGAAGEWSAYGKEQARAALRVLGRAGQRTIDESKRLLEQVQREAPEVWRNEVLPRLERAARNYKAQVNYLARTYMPPADAPSAARAQAALDVRERGTQAFRELQQVERTLLKDVGDRLAARRRATVEEQRSALLAAARMRGQQRAELERRMRNAREAELRRLANATIVAPPSQTLVLPRVPKTSQSDAALRNLADRQVQSALFADWDEQMRNARAIDRKRVQQAENLAKAHKNAQESLAEGANLQDENVQIVEQMSDGAISLADITGDLTKPMKLAKLFYCLSGVWGLLGGASYKFTDAEIERCAKEYNIDNDAVIEFKKKFGENSAATQATKFAQSADMVLAAQMINAPFAATSSASAPSTAGAPSVPGVSPAMPQQSAQPQYTYTSLPGRIP